MPTQPPEPTARKRIVDAAATVMRRDGIAKTTTKSIAAAAGYSEAMLYKHFTDKQQLFLAVLKEKLRPITPSRIVAGDGDLADNLAAIVEQLMGYFVELFPMAASLFGTPTLLAEHREGVTRHDGWGPSGPIRVMQRYLESERDAGRVRPGADTDSVARLLVGAAFQQGFLAAFEGLDDVPRAAELSTELVAAVSPMMQPTGSRG